jgi:hypothetical protein
MKPRHLACVRLRPHESSVRGFAFHGVAAMARKEYVYFIQQGVSGPVKIGRSYNPTARMAQLQTAHADRLRMLYFERGGRDEECRLHAKFSECHISGEWFELTTEMLQYIETWRFVDSHDEPHLLSEWCAL